MISKFEYIFFTRFRDLECHIIIKTSCHHLIQWQIHKNPQKKILGTTIRQNLIKPPPNRIVYEMTDGFIFVTSSKQIKYLIFNYSCLFVFIFCLLPADFNNVTNSRIHIYHFMTYKSNSSPSRARRCMVPGAFVCICLLSFMFVAIFLSMKYWTIDLENVYLFYTGLGAFCHWGKSYWSIKYIYEYTICT